jgi:uncharacterized protein YbaP (TraB family)
MKLTLTFLSLFFFLSTSWISSAQVANQSLLWEISGNNLAKSSYLLGTIHLLPKKDFQYSSKLDSILSRIDEVIFEIDLNEMEDYNVLLEVMMQSFMTGTTLQSLVSNEEYELIKNFISDMGLPMYVLDRLKPMFLNALVEGSSLGQLENSTSVEMELYQRALAKNKRTGGLETMAFQMSIFDSIPYQDQARMLIESIQLKETQPDALQNLINLYQKGAVEELYQLVSEENEKITRIMIHQRNSNWVKQMENKMKMQSGLYAVGAGHLGGPKGLIKLLLDKGYLVQPIPLF